ncbi:MAG: prevent-host-death family protein [Chloroflexi bacterium]|nr:prevent-host-death family protein [Chloroflexota bacterium]
MAIETSYTEARANLARLMTRVTSDRETVIITRRGGERVAMIAADELESLIETDYLLRSPANAGRLLAALDTAQTRKGKRMTVGELRRKFGLEVDQ